MKRAVIADAARSVGLEPESIDSDALMTDRPESAPDTHREEPPATSRSPSIAESGVIVAARPSLASVRNALVEALAHVDALQSRGAA
jgi:hypothetical protein